MNTYMPQHMRDLIASPVYAARTWRKFPQESVETMDEFLAWYEEKFIDEEEDEKKAKQNKKTLEMLKSLAAQFQGKDKKVVEGENILLARWIEACKTD